MSCLFSSLFKTPHIHTLVFLTHHLPTEKLFKKQHTKPPIFSFSYRIGFRNSPKKPWPARISMRRRLSGSDNSLSLSVEDRLRLRLGSRLAESRFRSAPRLTVKNSSKPPWVLLPSVSDFAFAFWIGILIVFESITVVSNSMCTLYGLVMDKIWALTVLNLSLLLKFCVYRLVVDKSLSFDFEVDRSQVW